MQAQGAQQLPKPRAPIMYNNLLTLLFSEKRSTLHYTGEQLWKYFSGSFGARRRVPRSACTLNIYTQGSNFIRAPGDATGLFETNDLIIYFPKCAGRKRALSAGELFHSFFLFISFSWSWQGRTANFHLDDQEKVSIFLHTRFFLLRLFITKFSDFANVVYRLPTRILCIIYKN